MISLLLDGVLIVLLVVGIVYAVKLHRQLAILRSSHAAMERFVVDFNGTVVRAESSIKGLKQAARSSGDDLEQLIEKAQKIIDEMTFMMESADQIADRLSAVASSSTLVASPAAAVATPSAAPKTAPPDATSAAEQDLLQALEKLG
jgi:hypothetical protein